MSNRERGDLASSFRHAIEGVRYVLAAERNARIDLVVAILAILVGAWLELSPLEWALVIASVALVFAGEMANTVVELTVDLITLEEHPLAKHAKDVAAGAVLVAATSAALIGVLILGPRLWLKLAGMWR